MDRYTKIVLTFIAVGVWGILMTNLTDSGHGPIGVANAQVAAAPVKVVIVGVQTTARDTPLSVIDVYARAMNSAASGTRSPSGSQGQGPQ